MNTKNAFIIVVVLSLSDALAAALQNQSEDECSVFGSWTGTLNQLNYVEEVKLMFIV